jgi:hypothetical protein
MTTVRPPVWPQAAAPASDGARPVDPAKMAAQRAFFEAALGRAPAAQPAAPAQPATPARLAEPAPPAQHATPVRPIQVDDDAQHRILRPGSLLNIVV